MFDDLILTFLGFIFIIGISITIGNFIGEIHQSSISYCDGYCDSIKCKEVLYTGWKNKCIIETENNTIIKINY